MRPHSERFVIVWYVCKQCERADEPDRQVLEDMDSKWPTAESLQMAWVHPSSAKQARPQPRAVAGQLQEADSSALTDHGIERINEPDFPRRA